MHVESKLRQQKYTTVQYHCINVVRHERYTELPIIRANQTLTFVSEGSIHILNC